MKEQPGILGLSDRQRLCSVAGREGLNTPLPPLQKSGELRSRHPSRAPSTGAPLRECSPTALLFSRGYGDLATCSEHGK